jgi:hypothetical protein
MKTLLFGESLTVSTVSAKADDIVYDDNCRIRTTISR